MNELITTLREKNLGMSQRGFAQAVTDVINFKDFRSFRLSDRNTLGNTNPNMEYFSFQKIYGRVRRIDKKRIAKKVSKLVTTGV